jgi:hypothetical protein
VRWETLEVDRLDGVTSLDELERQVQLVWDRTSEDDSAAMGTEWMLRVVLSGSCPLWSELRTEEDRDVLASELRDLLGALDVTVMADGVHPVLSLDEHRARVDVLGEALRLAGAVRRGDARLPALDPGDLVGVGSEDPEALERYVRDLLEGMDAELAARLLEEPSA